MKTKLFSILVFSFIATTTTVAQTSSSLDTISKGTFILHKFQQAIGKEKYYIIIGKKDSIKLHSDFKFKDRGQEVPSVTTLVLNKSGVPVYFKQKGRTSRTSVIGVEVSIKADSVVARTGSQTTKSKKLQTYFTISGYSPVAVQMQLIKFWKQIGKPATLPVTPSGNLKIKFDGYDTIKLGNEKKILERYFVKGLIWGSEMIWTAANGELVALFTNDAEGDKFEAMAEAYESVMPDLISKAAVYGMANLKKSQSNEKSNSLALTNGSIIDVVTGNTISKGTIIIENGIISNVGSPDKIKIPKSAKVVDLQGKSVLPGLWDMHAHFQQVEWGPAYLAAGVTTVRDCGNEFDFVNSVKKAIDKNEGVGPRILRAGIVDGESPFALSIVRANTAEDAKSVVKRYKDAGYDQIKIYSSVKAEMIKAIADEAHKVGLTVTGHIPQGVKLLDAIALGQDQVNHFTFLLQAMRTPENAQKKIVISDTLPQKVLKTLKEKNTVVDPTLGIYEWILRPLDKPVDAFEPGINYVTEDLKEIFRNTGLPAADAEKRKYILESGKEIVLAMHKMGITVVAGTDMMVPGFSLFREIELYNEAGLTPLEAIQTATINPARVMKLEKETGSIAQGKKADLIIIDGNPLQRISDIRKLTHVIKAGKVYQPSELRELVDFKAN